MHTRERGAAHVNIFFFLVMLVLFLGALGFGYAMLGKNTELEEAIKTANARVKDANRQALIYKHYVEDITAEVGEAGAYAGREGFDYSEYGTPEPLQNVAVPTRVRASLTDFARSSNVPEQRGLAAVFGLVTKSREELLRQIENSKSTNAGVQAQVAELNKSVGDVTKSAQAREATLSREVSDTRTDLQNSIDAKDRLLASQNAEYGALRTKMSDQAAEHAKAVAALRKEIETLQARTAAAADKVKLVNPAQEKDGLVIESSQATGLAWINLGTRDMLPLGTSFEVVKPLTGEVKATAVVRRVEQTRAEVLISNLKDRYDPVMAGDEIRNDLYSVSMRHNVYLMGRFSHPLTKPVVAALLADLGNNVVDKLGPGVDLIIVGGDLVNEEGSGFTPITESEEYKLAQNLRIEMAPLSKVRQYLKLPETSSN